MGKKAVTVLPATLDILMKMGEQIKLARLRRNLSVDLTAERAGISRATLWKVEKGDPSVAIGIYASVLHALNDMDKDLLLVAQNDPLGNILEQEVGRDVMTAVKQLPDKQRVVVLLHYTQDYSTGEIAGILHIPRGTVLSRLAKARQNIRSYLEGRGYEI